MSTCAVKTCSLSTSSGRRIWRPSTRFSRPEGQLHNDGGPDVRLRIVAFGAGGVLMSLELAGSRVLAPYFGSSVYVWGGLIGAFLGALSAGDHLGGAGAGRGAPGGG